jgi:cytochrome c oxidase cbb3-type subunit 3
MGTQYQPNQLRGHAEDCDGIEEYDNKLPTWWVGLFIFTIIWGVVVMFQWHGPEPRTLASVYDADVAAALAAAGPQIDVSEIEIVMSDEAIAAGATVFGTTCASCHQADATGGIGPNLTDAEWIHGSSPNEIRDVIAHGVLEKGMPAWLPVIGPDGLATVTAFVASLSAP